MASIVLTCWGSHGDVDPYLGLALELQRRGHRVTFATLEYYRDLVEARGFDFRPIRPAVNPSDMSIVRKILDRRRGSEFLLREIMFPAMADAYADLDAAVAGADLLVSHPLSFAAPLIAERLGLPWASSVLAPLSFFSADDFPVFPPAPWLKSLERLGRWPGRILVGLAKRHTRSWITAVVAFRQQLGLPPGANPIFEGQHAPRLVLGLFSRVLGQPQADWPPNVVITGHVFHDAPHGTSLPNALDAFLDDGPPPVVFTLGSSVVLIADRFWDESIAAVRRMGSRAVFLAGPGNAATLSAALPSGSLAVDIAPHSLLFPRAAAVVQQCGIGTMAQSLRSGRPTLAVPFAHDQPDNAWRAERLGVARILHPPRYRGPRIARELRRLLDDPSYATTAAAVAAQVRAEGGARTACDALEQTFRL